MGFRTNAYATVWEVSPVSDTMTKVRLSTSKKNKQTGEYETDFSGFVGFVGSVAAKNAAMLSVKDRIKLGDIDVTTKYDKEKKLNYTNYVVFNFETANGGTTNVQPQTTVSVDDGEIISDGDCPF